MIILALHTYPCALFATLQARMVHAVPKGVQLPSRHLYLLERLEDKVAAMNSRITTWQLWLAAALTTAAAAGAGAGAAGAADGSSADSSIEWSAVGAPVQVGHTRLCCGKPVWLALSAKGQNL